MIRKALALLLLGLSAKSVQSATDPLASSPPDSESVSQVWGREADYWRFVKEGDVESYVSLWHDRFIGWPCGQDHPKRKASIGDWVREVRDNHIQVDSNLTREGAEDFGNVVVVHYRFTRVDTYPNVESGASSRAMTRIHSDAVRSGVRSGSSPGERVGLSARPEKTPERTPSPTIRAGRRRQGHQHELVTVPTSLLQLSRQRLDPASRAR